MGCTWNGQCRFSFFTTEDYYLPQDVLLPGNQHFLQLGLVCEDPSGVICDYSKREMNPFKEFRIINLRWANAPLGHSQEFSNSLYHIDENGCNNHKTVIWILTSVVSYEIDFFLNNFPFKKCGKTYMNDLHEDWDISRHPELIYSYLRMALLV